jgi:methionyl-tRNA formyltransferase
MDDPIQTYNFIKNIINDRKDDIVGLAIPDGDRLTLSKDKSKYVYILSLLLIMGPYHFAKNVFITIHHKIKKKLGSFGWINDPTIIGYAQSNNIEVKRIKSPNNKEFRKYLESLNLDIIINQSQSFIKKDLLEIPKIGVLNRHNALLPKNRGRLTPFWVLYKGEKETGVSIHFVEESLDSGDIIIQKKYSISRKDTFNTLVKKNYSFASQAMLDAIKKLEQGRTDFLPNDDNLATYNSTPSLKEALRYRYRKLKRYLK